MQNHTGKTKTAMLLELESIKGLLVEEDDIPILQEIVSTSPQETSQQSEAMPEDYIPILSIVVSDDALGEQAAAAQHPIAAEQDSPAQPLGSQATPQTQTQTIATRDQYSLEDIAEGLMASSSSAISIENALLSAANAYLTSTKPHTAIQQETSAEQDTTETLSPETSVAQQRQGVEHRQEHRQDHSPEHRQDHSFEHRQEQQQDFFQLVDEYHPEPEPESNTKPQPLAALVNRLATPPTTAPAPTTTAASQNPFLPEHIRARLQKSSSAFASHNSPEQAGDIHSRRLKGLALGSIHSPSPTTKKPSPIQQQLINEIMDKMLPEMARELRAKLEKMSKQMLEQLLAER